LSRPASVDLGERKSIPLTERNLGEPVIQMQPLQFRRAAEDFSGCLGPL
jgi:hypothetical protein